MRRLAWIVTIPLTAIVLLFAVDNRQTVDLELWPLPWALPPLPLFLLTLVLILFGFLIGVAAMWFSGARQRRRLRALKQELDNAKSELYALRHRNADISDSQPSGTAISTTQRRLPPAA